MQPGIFLFLLSLVRAIFPAGGLTKAAGELPSRGVMRMSESSQNYSPSQILAIGQRAEAEGKFDYATQFYAHLADHYRNTAEGHEALYGLQRIERYRQAHFATQSRAGHAQVQTMNPAQSHPVQGQQQPAQRREPQPLLHQQQRQYEPQAAARAVRVEPSGHLQSVQERAVTPNVSANRSSLPVRVSDHDDDEEAGLPRLVARHIRSDETEGDHAPDYRVGRLFAVILSGVGWMTLLIGFVLLVAGLAGIHPIVSTAGYAGLPAGVELGIAAISAGFIMVFMSHLARAVFDSAGAARELVEIERAKAGW